VQPRHRSAAARLDHLKFTNNGISIGGLGEPDYAVGYSKNGISLLLLGVFAEEEGSHLPAREVKGEALNELVDARCRPRLGADMLASNRAE